MTAERTDRFGRLVTLLKELFQLDKPDLDFGFYRIMHAKEAEVTRFLKDDLLPQVKHAFQQYRSADRATLEQQLAEAERDARGLGVDPDAVPKVQELRKMIAAGTDVDALEADVYDHLYRFFRRYYSEGDFISQRVYKEGVYAIPYQGEEVKLHWANADQYYIKTTEYLKDYSFRLHPEAEGDSMRVHFRLADAAEGEHGNVKAADEKARRFVLLAEDFVAEEDGPDGVRELVIRFAYRAATLGDWPEEKRKGKKRPPQQKDLNEAAATAVLGATDLSLVRWIKHLAATHVKADGTQADYTRLRAHLNRYTARNTYDYFIHKDLGGFLRRELDFYVKNEVMHLDDIEQESAPRVEEWLSKIKVIRAIAHKIIDFLAQLEGFQKKLWLKKKFVVETSYCVAVRSIPKAFYAEIVANRAQHDEWVDLHGIDGFAGDLVRAGYSNPVTTEFLRAHPTLMVDTRFFTADFTERLLEALATDDSLDELTDGVLFHSENFQALRLMERRYRGQVDCVYIDPPYNTGNDGFAYKDNLQHSSWMAHMDDRVNTVVPLTVDDGSLFVSIDDNEVGNLVSLAANLAPKARLAALIAAQLNPRGRTLDKYFAKTHEYVAAFALHGGRAIHQVGKSAQSLATYRLKDERGKYRLLELRNRNPVFTRENRPNLYYPFFTSESGGSVTLEARSESDVTVLPMNSLGEDGCWTWSKEKAAANLDRLIARRVRTGAWRVFRKDYLQDARGIESKTKPKALWIDKSLNNERGKEVVGDLFGSPVFDFPKPVALVRKCIDVGMQDRGWFADYFAGSGTSAHAVLGVNREDGGDRRFILVEMAHYFDTVLLPRVKKVTFSPEWKNGRPARLATSDEAKRSPRIVKVVRLESYEDTLNNLVVHRPEQVQRLLEVNTDGGAKGAREDYIIRYMLDVETGNSPSLLDLSAFLDPSAYRLKVKRPGSDESREVTVDLIETFNWLLGLHVGRMSAPTRYDAEFRDAGQSKPTATIALTETPDGRWWFRTADGVLPDGGRALIIWRNRPSGDDPDGVERDNAVLDAWFKQSGYDARQAEFDLIYVNGDHNLDSLKDTEQTWTGHTIEDYFKRLMFEDAEERAEPW